MLRLKDVYADENFYPYITYLAKAINNGGTYYRRNIFEIALGGYDMGYELSVDGTPFCWVNFEYREFDGNPRIADDYNLDLDKIKKIFEKVNGIHLHYAKEYKGYNTHKKSGRKTVAHKSVRKTKRA